MARLLASIVVASAACSSPKAASMDPGDAAGTTVDAPSPGDGDTTIDAPVSAACTGMAAQPLDADWTVGGRSVKVHVPASYDPTQRTPVVINLHGWSSNGLDQARISHMIAKSDASGFIAVHPEGHDSPQGWNAGICCGTAATSGVDDTAFISAVIDALAAKLCTDPARVFAAGLSNGGFMSHRLGCELADKIAAFTAVAGVLGITSCDPSRPVPVLHIHGTADPLIPYNGGGVNGSLSVADTIAFWATHNHCTTGPTQVFQQGDATCVVNSGCDQGADVELCTIQNGGHQWPGGEDIFLGTLSHDLIATDAMWTFFQAHPRPN